MDPTLLMLFTEPSFYHTYRQFEMKRKFQTHPINRERKKLGEYHHLFKTLRQHKDRFFEYTRMSISSFDLLLLSIEDKLQNKIHIHPNRSINAEEKLVVTLR